MESLKKKIKSVPALKKTAQWLLNAEHDPRPRWLIRAFVNPFVHKKGGGSIVRKYSRMDLFPFNKFFLGECAIIEDYAVINNGVGDVEIGSHSIIGVGCVVIGPISVGKHVMFAQHVVASGLNHGYQDIHQPISHQQVECKRIIVEDEVWIGANSVITAGVTLGKHSVVGAGSVVTKDVPPFSIVAGNPARVIKQYNNVSKNWERV
ncbi:acetyltransferase [Niabella ginsenosidivorans]|uniref:Acetyltransferase n=1 Tax=Niabella ginsenosidivorans TaxID=1176587 RepID=A0A1A9HYK1_9BACT|nr:acyltransferase [Niabella ginsenosidivorans]ANH80446.1 acetyltransferase [Niabella ginsenosidivorans]